MGNLPMTLSLFLVLLPLLYVPPTAYAATFTVKNNCGYTVWGAASPGGGQQLNPGATWTFNVPAGTSSGRVWARTGCQSNGPNGLTCATGDCGGVLQCTGYGQSPNTLAEYTLNGYMNQDFIDISLIQGFNVPMSFLGASNGCNKGATCSADINAQCPSDLKTNGGCNNPCSTQSVCGPNAQTQFFKGLCPQTYTYPTDTTLFTCPGGTNYVVTFCP